MTNTTSILNNEIKLSAKVKAFTLVELVMVITILGVVSIFVLPRFFSKDSFEQRFFVDELISAIKYSQKSAVASGCLTQLRFLSGSYTIHQDRNCFDDTVSTADFVNEVWDPGTFEFGYTRTIDTSLVSVTSTENIIIFDARGRPLTSSLAIAPDITIDITGEVNRQITITQESGWVSL